MPRTRRVDIPETLEDESLLDAPDTEEQESPVDQNALSDDERAGYALSLRGLESLRLTTFCTNEARVLRVFIDKLESLFGKP